MRRCHRCDRHVFEASTRCPFCDAPHRVVAIPVLGVLLGLAGTSCSDRPSDDQGTGSGTTTSASSTSGITDTTGDGASGPLSSTADGTSTTLGPATTAMTTTATDDGTTSGSTSGDITTGTTTGNSEDTFPLPPYAGAFPDDDQSTATTTGDPEP